MLLEILSKIMDLPSPLCLYEAQKKLVETWMVINGELHYVYLIENDMVKTDKALYGEKDIKSMEPFLPDVGVYLFDKYPPLILSRKAKKQWRKSFTADAYKYNAYWETRKPIKFALSEIVEHKIKPVEFWVKKNIVSYLDKPIGSISKGELILKEPMFEQELIDLGKVDKAWTMPIKVLQQSSTTAS